MFNTLFINEESVLNLELLMVRKIGVVRRTLKDKS
jgi:DNA-binding CsgD family transcriptional regulator